MKRISLFLISALSCLMLLTACNQQGASIGVLDEAAAFRDNGAAKAAMEFLQKKSAPLQKEAETAYKAMQENKTDKTSAAYRDAMGKLQGVMGTEQQRVVGLLNEQFDRVIEDYRKAKGLKVIISRKSALAMDDSIDVTKEIVAEMDKVTIDFAAKAEVSENAAPEKATEEKAAAEKPADDEKKAE